MLTKNELTALSLSPTKKDFVQIWNELLEVAGKLSERWDPTSTNESDPGIVILKALTGIADKLNYNIDKNTLEAFMPTAAQEDSMRKLCDMLGYNIKYYRSAETTVTIKWYNSDPSEDEANVLSGRDGALTIPKFTVITNNDQDINYFTTNTTEPYITSTTPYVTVSCMEGQIVKCESITDNNVITVSQISENNRFYLPEAQIAENGLFVYNVTADMLDGEPWAKVDNLNVQARGSRVFKFGYDSYEGRPYIEFPEDYSELFKDGLFIYYARTSGANGNISARTLTRLEPPSTAGWDKVSIESFSVENAFAATTGANIETIGQAYHNFKKTVGTFESLVTCRDYMNKIYTMLDSSTGKPLVSNILATDIRNDLNRAITICSCDDAGIFYKEMALVADRISTSSKVTTDEAISESYEIGTATKPVYSTNATWAAGSSDTSTHWHLGSVDGFPLFDFNLVNNSAFDNNANGEVLSEDDSGNPSAKWLIRQNGTLYETIWPVERLVSTTKTITHTEKATEKVEESVPAIDRFDLVLYPFKSYNQIRGNVKDIQEVYDASFKYSAKSFNTVKSELEESALKTLAHNIVAPREQDIISINNYLRLSAIIGTNSKVTTEEGTILIENIKIALANAFNMRELDFGEEIPFDSIVEVIEKADSRIKIVSLNEPALYTTFSVFKGNDSVGNPIIKEYAVASEWLTESAADASGRFDNTDTDMQNTFNTKEAKEIYNKLVVRNILAGRVPLFNYNTTFSTNFSEGAYRTTNNIAADMIPENLQEPSAEEPFTACSANGKTYTGQWSSLAANEAPAELIQLAEELSVENPSTSFTDEDTLITYECSLVDGIPEYSKITYTETTVPQEYLDNDITNNLITKGEDDNNITEIISSCEIYPDTDAKGNSTGKISEVTLASGEFIKFRAPNFTTSKTFPAYVNYHLSLNKETLATAVHATAHTLASLLNAQSVDRGMSVDDRRQTVLDYFDNLERKKTFTLGLTIYGKKPDDTEIVQDDSFTLEVDNPSATTPEVSPEELIAKSGFIKLSSKFATLKWLDQPENSTVPNIDFPELNLTDTSGVSSLFITNSAAIDNIKQKVEEYLVDINTNNPDMLPEDDWTLSYSFEYVPFDAALLADWVDLIKSHGTAMFGFAPQEESRSILWRTYGSGYAAGKYILADTSKLLSFTSGHFDLLNENRLEDIYIIEDFGADLKANFISNNEEYMLRQHEYLYIEYTPSTTTDDGSTSQVQASIKEIIGPGTIIKPSGFEGNLIDSSLNIESGKSSHKTVTFKTAEGTSLDIPLYSLGASEQIEVREFAQVRLDKDAFTNSSTIYVYKNFNNCPELEIAEYENGVRKNNSYTLQDGEYVFYTDQNKAELAYFTTGTEVTLTGTTVLPKFDAIDLATIFDVGIQEIPWVSRSFSADDGIVFQEYQYITLGNGDTLKELMLSEPTKCLTDQWQSCDSVVKYLVAGAEEVSQLPKINISESNNSTGWEACSLLELSTSPSSAQTLRTTDKVKTSIKLNKSNSSGVVDPTKSIELAAVDADHPVSFKTNLLCQSSSSHTKLTDLYTNFDNLKSFELKVFSEEAPAILKTEPGKLVPHRDSTVTDITMWPVNTEAPFTGRSYGELWNTITLDNLISTSSAYDNALRLSVSTLPNTYGIFSIYIAYTDLTSPDACTWIEVMPGTSHNDITLLNVDKNDIDWQSAAAGSNYPDKLILKPGINCIRVNKTCNIFIKTSAAAGTLAFDDIRLVNCLPVEYTRDGQTYYQETQGLNLAQLGYLDTLEEGTLNVFDMRIRQKLKEEYLDEALNKLETQLLQETKNFGAFWKDLLASKDKLQSLVSFIEGAKQEVEGLLKSDNNDTVFKTEAELIALCNKYKEVYDILENELVLREALNNNQNITELEQQLVELLESLASAEVFAHELLDKLDSLDQQAQANSIIFDTNKLSKSDILEDFENSSDTSIYTQLVSDLKLSSIKKINAIYSAKLATLEATISEVVNEDNRNSLLSILQDINIAKHSELLTQIQQLLEANQETLQDSLTDALTLATGTNDGTGKYSVDYSALATLLVNIREQLSSADKEEIISQIELIVNSSMVNSDKYSELQELITELTQLLAANDTAVVGSYAYLIGELNTVLAAVQAKVTAQATDFDSLVFSAIEQLYTKVNQIDISQIQSVLTDIQAILTALSNNYSAALEELETAEEVTEILTQLSTYADERTAQLALVTEFNAANLGDYADDLPYGTDVLLSVWPSYMKRAFIIGVDSLYKNIRKAILNQGIADTAIIDSIFYNGDILRSALAETANLNAYTALLEQANNLASKNLQNSKRKELVNQLGQLILPSNGLSTAMDSLLATSLDRNAVLHQVITELKTNPTITKKQQLFKSLKTELDTAIAFDTQLVEISAKLLCPSLLIFDSLQPSFKNDSFYSALVEYITITKNTLMTNIPSGSIVTVLESYLSELESTLTSTALLLDAINMSDITQFTYWEDTSLTKLSTDYRETLQGVKLAIDNQSLINSLKKCKLLTTLQRDLSVAWQDAQGNWMDSAGNYYGEVPLVDVKRWYNGVWQEKLSDNTYASINIKDNNGWYVDANTSIILTEANESEQKLAKILDDLLAAVTPLGQLNDISDTFKDAYSILMLEEQLLADIRAIDKNRDFYWNVPIESNVAIDFNEGEATLNTLMNPAINYDINNINNNFVISKIDINYLTKGLQIARSSKIS